MGKMTIGIFAFLMYISFAYYTKEQVQELYSNIDIPFVGTYNIPMPAAFDMPTLLVIVLLLWALYVGFLFGVIFLKKTSDIIIADGMDSPESCTGSDVDNQIVGDLAFIKVGGTKDIPMRGSHVWINPVSHIHKIGTHLIFTGKMEPNTSIMNVPLDLKPHIRPRRNTDFFKIEDVSVGYFTSKELDANIEADWKDFVEYKETSDGDSASININTFLTELRIENRQYDYQLQSNENENTGVTDHLRAQAETGRSVRILEKKGIWEQLGLR